MYEFFYYYSFIFYDSLNVGARRNWS